MVVRCSFGDAGCTGGGRGAPGDLATTTRWSFVYSAELLPSEFIGLLYVVVFSISLSFLVYDYRYYLAITSRNLKDKELAPTLRY